MNRNIFIMVPPSTSVRGSLYLQAAKVLIESLGLPQVRVAVAGDEPQDCAGIIVFSTDDSEVSDQIERMHQCPVWQFSDGPIELSGCITVKDSVDRFDIPGHIRRQWVPSPNGSGSSAKNMSEVALYYALKRLRKLGAASSESPLEWGLLLDLLGDHGLGKQIHGLLIQNGITPEFLSNKNNKISGIKKFMGKVVGSSRQETSAYFLREPHQAIRKAISLVSQDKRDFALIIEKAVSRATKANQLALLGISAFILGNTIVFKRAEERLWSEFLDVKGGYVRSALSLKSYCYEPALAVFFIMLVRVTEKNFIPHVMREDSCCYRWNVYPKTPTSIGQITGEKTEGFIADGSGRLISQSLLDNWMLAMLPPESHLSMQFELGRSSYLVDMGRLERIWMEVFCEIFRDIDLPMVKIHPWPFNYSAALSLRYDVDRTPSLEQVGNILRIQKDHLTQACGSWYFFSSEDLNSELCKLLLSSGQELGVHEVSAVGVKYDGVGVTFHSGPNSEYWRGDYSLRALFKRGASYVELLSSQCRIPRTLLQRDVNGHKNMPWVLPLHFPLEGGTSNEGLEYFDRLLSEFRELRDAGGYLILGSHPDVDQSHLEQLIERENFYGVWFATVSEVVKRCKETLGYGEIIVNVVDLENITVKSRNDISDIKLSVLFPNGHIVLLGPLKFEADRLAVVQIK